MAAAKDFKITIVGASGVGKTSLLARLQDKQLPRYVPTLGADHATVCVDTDCGMRTLNIHDCGDFSGPYAGIGPSYMLSFVYNKTLARMGC